MGLFVHSTTCTCNAPCVHQRLDSILELCRTFPIEQNEDQTQNHHKQVATNKDSTTTEPPPKKCRKLRLRIYGIDIHSNQITCYRLKFMIKYEGTSKGSQSYIEQLQLLVLYLEYNRTTCTMFTSFKWSAVCMYADDTVFL